MKFDKIILGLYNNNNNKRDQFPAGNRTWEFNCRDILSWDKEMRKQSIESCIFFVSFI